MSAPIPTVRAASLLPMVVWLNQQGKSVERALAGAELSYAAAENPMQAIPLRNVARLLTEMAHDHGPDLPARVVAETTAITGAMIGSYIARARTPRGAVASVSLALPHFSSHEHLSLEPGSERSRIRHFWAMTFDTETLHYLQQFTCAMTDQILRQVPDSGPDLPRFSVLPHPVAGLNFMKNHFRCDLAAGGRVLVMDVANALLDAPFRNAMPPDTPLPSPPAIETLRATGDLAGTARLLIRSMLEVGTPTVEDLALAAGLSKRTLQRNLRSQRTSFSQLLDAVRKDAAIEWLELDAGNLAELSYSLGFAHPSAFTRAMHRWVGTSPSDHRNRSKE